jgi:hypothetical protein
LAWPNGAVDEIVKTDFGEHDAALNAEEVLEGFEFLLVFYNVLASSNVDMPPVT